MWSWSSAGGWEPLEFCLAEELTVDINDTYLAIIAA